MAHARAHTHTLTHKHNHFHMLLFHLRCLRFFLLHFFFYYFNDAIHLQFLAIVNWRWILNERIYLRWTIVKVLTWIFSLIFFLLEGVEIWDMRNFWEIDRNLFKPNWRLLIGSSNIELDQLTDGFFQSVYF